MEPRSADHDNEKVPLDASDNGLTAFEGLTVDSKALDIIQEEARTPPTPEELRRVLWKIDLIILPVLFFVNFLNFADKATLSYANLLGIQPGLDLRGKEFANAGTFFYVGYLCYQPIAAYLLQKLPLRWHLGGVLLIWGGVLCCHAAVQNYAGLAAVRVFLGCAESAMIVAFTAITGMWYTRKEQTTRVGIWFSSIAFAQILGGIIAYGILKMPDPIMERWRLVFLIYGLITLGGGAWYLAVVPSTQSGAWWLTKREKYVALERIRSNLNSTVSNKFEAYQVREAIRDPRLYFLSLAVFCSGVPNGGVSSFGAIIIEGFGFDRLETTLVGMATGASEFVGIVVCIFVSRKCNNRIVPAMVATSVAILGAILMIAPPETQRNLRFGGYCLLFWWPVAIIFLLSWMASMVAGHTKKICFLVCYQLFYAGGNVTGTQIFNRRDAPAYIPAKIGILIGLIFQATFLALIWYTHRIWNRRRDAKLRESGLDLEDEPDGFAFSNKTDTEQKRFRYPY